VSIVALVALVGGALTQFGVLAAPASVAPAAWAVAAVSLVVAVAVFFAGRRARSNLAKRREEQVRRAALEAIERVIQESMGEPTQVLLDDHRRVRELAQEARDPDRSSPLAGALRLPTADSGDSPSTESPTPG
jgi:parvulin-like peptidyl-prolyl isomerase